MVGLLVVFGIFAICLVIASHLLLAVDFSIYKPKYREMENDTNVVFVKTLEGASKESEVFHFGDSEVLVIDKSFFFGEGRSLIRFMPVFCHPYSLYWYIKYVRLLKKLSDEGKIREL